MSTSVTLMVTAGHCRKCQLISNEGFQAAETGQSPSLSRQTFSWWNVPHSPDSPHIGQNALSGLRQLANLENGVIFARRTFALTGWALRTVTIVLGLELHRTICPTTSHCQETTTFDP